MNPSTVDRRGTRFRVEGTVQGVGFRWWTRDRAAELGLVGTVRNLPDGSVEVVAFGPPEALAALRQVIDNGPPSAEVVRVTEASVPTDTPPPSDFKIVR